MSETFAIVPAGRGPLYIIIPVLFVMLAVGGILVMAWHASQTASFTVSPEGLRLRGDLYGRMIPARQLRIAEARVVPIDRTSEYRPRSRRMGTGMPGYGAGWFRLANGEKSLVYITRGDRAAYVPTTEGYSVLLTVHEPERFVASLKRIGNH